MQQKQIIILVIVLVGIYLLCNSKNALTTLSEDFGGIMPDAYPEANSHDHFYHTNALLSQYYPSGLPHQGTTMEGQQLHTKHYYDDVTEAQKAAAGTKYFGQRGFAVEERQSYLDKLLSCVGLTSLDDDKEDFISMPRIQAQRNPWEGKRSADGSCSVRDDQGRLIRNAAGLSVPELTYSANTGLSGYPYPEQTCGH